MKRIGLLSAAFAAMIAIGCAGDGRDNEANRPANDTAAVGTAGERTADANRVTNEARDWVEDVAMANVAEVKLGEMASQRAQQADVKAFGRMMVQDHTKAGEELEQLTSKHNLQPPAQLDDDHRDTSERLMKLQAGEFDREYMNTMVDEHEKTLNKLEERLDKEGDNDNPRYTPKQTENQFEMQLNQWAAKTVPTIRQHLERARQLDQKLDRRTTDNDR